MAALKTYTVSSTSGEGVHAVGMSDNRPHRDNFFLSILIVLLLLWHMTGKLLRKSFRFFQRLVNKLRGKKHR